MFIRDKSWVLKQIRANLIDKNIVELILILGKTRSLSASAVLNWDLIAEISLGLGTSCLVGVLVPRPVHQDNGSYRPFRAVLLLCELASCSSDWLSRRIMMVRHFLSENSTSPNVPDVAPSFVLLAKPIGRPAATVSTSTSV